MKFDRTSRPPPANPSSFAPPFCDRRPERPEQHAVQSLLSIILQDLRTKARWCYQSERLPSLVKTLLTDGTAAMVLYRFMQRSRRYRLWPLEMAFNKLNAVLCNCI